VAHYPPYELGLFGDQESPNPCLVNNVQTYAHVPGIVTHGGEAFAGIGSAGTPGTLLVTLSGAVRRPGVYEVESGIPLREVFEKCGGGPPEGRRWKAALQGVSAEAIPAERFDTAADFDALTEAGSGLGAAGFVLIDDATPMPRVAQMVARFLYVESCAQCPACKVGLEQSSVGLDRLVKGETDAMDAILEGARHAPQGNRCYLPVQGSRLIPSLVEMFPEEFESARRGELAETVEFPVPKFVDFDEARGLFVYDERQMLKEPDWSYREAEEEAADEAEDEPGKG
jgi:NADH-quinone oxidoreductase subunit F